MLSAAESPSHSSVKLVGRGLNSVGGSRPWLVCGCDHRGGSRMAVQTQGSVLQDRFQAHGINKSES